MEILRFNQPRIDGVLDLRHHTAVKSVELYNPQATSKQYKIIVGPSVIDIKLDAGFLVEEITVECHNLRGLTINNMAKSGKVWIHGGVIDRLKVGPSWLSCTVNADVKSVKSVTISGQEDLDQFPMIEHLELGCSGVYPGPIFPKHRLKRFVSPFIWLRDINSDEIVFKDLPDAWGYRDLDSEYKLNDVITSKIIVKGALCDVGDIKLTGVNFNAIDPEAGIDLYLMNTDFYDYHTIRSLDLPEVVKRVHFNQSPKKSKYIQRILDNNPHIEALWFHTRRFVFDHPKVFFPVQVRP